MDCSTKIRPFRATFKKRAWSFQEKGRNGLNHLKNCKIDPYSNVCACVFPEEHAKEMVTQATNTRRTHRILQNKNNSTQYVQQRLEKMWGWWVGKYINVLLDTFKIKHCIETQCWAGGFPILKGHTISPIYFETDRQFKLEYILFVWCEYMNMYEHDTRLWMLLWPSRKKRNPITQVDKYV